MASWWYDRHGGRLIVASLSLCPLIAVGAYFAIAEKHTDLLSWLPRRFVATREYQWFQQHFPGDRVIVASWEGCTLDDKRLDAFASQLIAGDRSRGPGAYYFEEVETGRDAIRQSEKLLFDNRRPTRQRVIERLQGVFFGPDAHQTCAMIMLSPQGESHLQDVMREIRRIATVDCGILEEQLHLGGIPVENRAVDAESEWKFLRLLSLSGAVCLAIAWLCLRNYRLVSLVLFVAVFSAATSVAVVWCTGGRIDAVLMTMPALVYVLALSGAVHMINYYRDARRQHGLVGATERAMRRGWLPCTLAAVTTAIGMLSLTTSQLMPVRYFGVYSAIGVLGSLFLLLGFLPAFLHRWPPGVAWVGESAGSALLSGPAQQFTSMVIRRHRWVCVAMIALLVIAGIGLMRVKTTTNSISLFSTGARIVRDYAWLEQHLGPLASMEVVLGIDTDDTRLNFLRRLELVEEVRQSLEDTDGVGQTVSLATFIPESVSGGLGGGFRQVLKRAVINRRLERRREDLVQTGYLSYDQKEEKNELWRISVRLSALSDSDYEKLADVLQERAEPVLDRYQQAGSEPIRVRYTGVVPLWSATHRQLMSGLVSSIALAFVAIAAVMMIVLRSARAGLLTMLPNLFPITIVFGVMGWLDVPVDIGSLLTASVALGVAVDDTVHFVAWYRRGREDGSEQREAVQSAYQACAKAMIQTTAIGGLGLLVFALSDFTATRRFGCLMFSLLAVALVGDLILLPALLAGRAGRLFNRSRTNRLHGN